MGISGTDCCVRDTEKPVTLGSSRVRSGDWLESPVLRISVLRAISEEIAARSETEGAGLKGQLSKVARSVAGGRMKNCIAFTAPGIQAPAVPATFRVSARRITASSKIVFPPFEASFHASVLPAGSPPANRCFPGSCGQRLEHPRPAIRRRPESGHAPVPAPDREREWRAKGSRQPP